MEERLFNNIKDRFSESGDDLGWNTPPDDLFSKAMNKKETKEKRKRYFYLFIPFSLLLMFSVTYFFIQSNNSQSQISTVKSSVLNPEPEQKTTILTENVLSEKTTLDSQKVNQQESKQTVESERRIDLFNDRILSKSDNSSLIFYEKNRNLISTVDVSKGQEKQILPSTIDRLPFLQKRKNQISCRSSDIILEKEMRLTDDVSMSPDYENSITVYFLSGFNSSRLCMTGDLSQDIELTGYDNYFEGVDLELGIELYAEKNLSPYFLLSYKQLNNSSFYSSSLDLNSEAFVHHQDGTMDYSFREMMTPMGMVDPEIEASLDQPNSNDPLVYQYADISQRVVMSQVGVGLNYAFLDLDRFSASLTSALSLNYFLKKNTEADLFLMDGSDNMMKEGQFQGSDMKGTKKFFYTHALGLQAEYRLNNRFNLAFRFNRMSNVGSILNYPTMNTKFNSYSTHMGLSMRI